jgi:hypothetical protein
VADFVVLTEKAQKVTMGEEDRSRSMDSHQGVFFAEMRAITRDYGLYPRAAVPGLICGAVYLTIAGAKAAGFQDGSGLRNSTLEFSVFKQL